MDRARNLALRLHALHAADRSWLLSHVEERQRRQLLALLAEVNEIGIVPDFEILAFAVPADTPMSAATSAAAMHIGMAAGSSIQQVLDQEPQSIQRCLLDLHAWPWRHELFRQRSEPVLGTFTVGRASAAKLTPRARASLLQAFAANLARVKNRPGAIVAAEVRKTGMLASVQARFKRP